MPPDPVTHRDPRRPIDRWLGHYAEHHRHGLNRWIHAFCVPLLGWSAIAALWTLPVPEQLARPGAWAALALAALLAFYFRLSRVLATALLLVVGLLMGATAWLHARIGREALGASAFALFVAAGIGLGVGQFVEGRPLSLRTALASLLVGPLWLAGRLLHRAGARW